MVVTLCLVLGFVAGRAGAGTEAKSMRRAGRIVVVRPGDTVWTIAQRLAGPDGDPRPLVDDLIALNHLRDAVIVPGERLAVP